LTFSALTEGPNRCKFTYTLKLSSDVFAPTVNLPLYIGKDSADKKSLEQKSLLQIVNFTINSIQEGPIARESIPKANLTFLTTSCPTA